MNICPITYRPCEACYSRDGLRKLSPRLHRLEDLPFTAEEQLREAAARASKMSIQGVQPKLSARLNVSKNRFDIVDVEGHFILKPQNPSYERLPENEDLSMRLAAAAGISTPVHGLVYSRDGSLTYFVKRFDRIGRNRKLAVEDFSQLMGLSRETKYDGSLEKVASVVEGFCTFPAVEKIHLFRLVLVCFLIGNEDMHLKNFSLITKGEKTQLTPAYDIVSTALVMPRSQEESALPVMGKKRKLNRSLLVDYFGRQRLGLNDAVVSKVLQEIRSALPRWKALVGISFLTDAVKKRYLELIDARWKRLF